LFSALVEHLRVAFVEQYPEDVFFEFYGVHLAEQDVSGFE
jgi:hypothetical protein